METEEEFLETVQFAKEVRFAQIHVFKYSRRQGTMADAMTGQLQESVKAERSEKLLSIEKELEKEYQESFCNKTEKVLFEEIIMVADKEYLVGYNERYVRIAIETKAFKRPQKYCNCIMSVQVLGHLTDEILFAAAV